MTLRVGLIGAGVMGADHARLLTGWIDGATVGGVHDVDAQRAEAVGTHVYADPFVLIDDSDIDAVLIASSDPTHERFVLAALAAGKPVLCEKPLAPDAAGCLHVDIVRNPGGARMRSAWCSSCPDSRTAASRRHPRPSADGAALRLSRCPGRSPC